MKEKYVDEVFPPWFIFGESRDGKHVDIYNGNDVANHVPRDQAEKIIAAHNKTQAALVEAVLAIEDQDRRWEFLGKHRP